ncbi:hypothetical protein [Bradyrhizobium canariense]|uniref:hypothetical protein n=1 Tax=Bradyrhizobium canariense TaxID=255045 RepID=UPI001B8A39CF|nr:hypothetical protein [Bradyrhizobium canariense]MBR0949003.1 hypothetical protein [Bradyrhizobium canariense]
MIVTQNKFYSSMSMEKEPAGAFNKAQRLNEQLQLYTTSSSFARLGGDKAWRWQGLVVARPGDGKAW